MPIKIKKNRKLNNLLDTQSSQGLMAEVRRRFGQKGTIKVKQAITQDMIRGISPVKGEGKWKRYSPSYKETIRGKKTFRKKGGKTVVFQGRDEEYHSKSKPTKQVSPVNLRHTGGLHRSLKVFTKGGFFRNFRLVTMFRSKLADIHNRRGAGKSKVKRRLLPTGRGEEFNRRISGIIITELKRAAEFIAKEFSRQ